MNNEMTGSSGYASSSSSSSEESVLASIIFNCRHSLLEMEISSIIANGLYDLVS